MDDNFYRNNDGLNQQIKQIYQVLAEKETDEFGIFIADLYSKSGTPFILALISSKLLEKFADKVNQSELLYQTENAIEILKRASKNDIYIIESLCHKYYALAKKICIKLEKKDKKIEFGMTSNPDLKEDSEFLEIILNFCEIKIQGSDSKNQEMKEKLIKKIMKYEYLRLINNEKNSYNDSAIIWVKESLSELLGKKNLCCRVGFSNNNIKNEYPLFYSCLASSEQSEIEKTIVSMMNARGGVILVGLNAKSDNSFSVEGIELQDESKKKAEIDKIKKEVNKIFPKHKHFEAEINEIKDEAGYIYRLNYYISVEFLPIYEIEDVLEKPKNQDDLKGKPEVYVYKYIEKKTKYVIRILVKMGHPRHFYHIFKLQKITGTEESNIVSFYTRNHTENTESTLGDATLKEIYVKLKAYERDRESNSIPKREKIHEECRHSMEMSENIFNIDEDSEE